MALPYSSSAHAIHWIDHSWQWGGSSTHRPLGDWKSARALFMVAFVYGVIVFFGLLYHLLTGTANQLFWGYLVVDAVFLFPIGYIFWVSEQVDRA